MRSERVEHHLREVWLTLISKWQKLKGSIFSQHAMLQNNQAFFQLDVRPYPLQIIHTHKHNKSQTRKPSITLS